MRSEFRRDDHRAGSRELSSFRDAGWRDCHSVASIMSSNTAGSKKAASALLTPPCYGRLFQRHVSSTGIRTERLQQAYKESRSGASEDRGAPKPIRRDRQPKIDQVVHLHLARRNIDCRIRNRLGGFIPGVLNAPDRDPTDVYENNGSRYAKSLMASC